MSRKKTVSAHRGVVMKILKRAHAWVISVIPESSPLYKHLYFLGLRVSAGERLRKRKALELCIPLVRHCNLNCRGCSAFSPISEPYFYTLENIKKDLGHISKIVGHKADCLYLNGGEPLLHPDLIEIIRYCRKCFPFGLIKIFTNGTLLQRQKEDFWKVCRDCGIMLWITHYPIPIDIEGIRKRAAAYGVEVSWADFSGGQPKTMWKIPYNLGGGQNADESFRMCRQANMCPHIQDGKLWPCGPLNNIAAFNKYFHQNLQVSQADCLKISEIRDKDEIFHFMCHSVPFCRYCNIKGAVFGLPWGVSKKSMDEWV